MKPNFKIITEVVKTVASFGTFLAITKGVSQYIKNSRTATTAQAATPIPSAVETETTKEDGEK